MKVAHDVPLAPLTTLQVGGTARCVVDIEHEDEIADALDLDEHEQTLVLGGGSNLVVPDAGWPGVVLRLRLCDVVVDDELVTAGAGVDWDVLVSSMVGDGRGGIECLSGIPGLVGATPMQNVGAYGQEVADTIVDVRVYDRMHGELDTIPAKDCGFGYRTSRFRGNPRWIIVGVRFRLRRADGSRAAPVRYAELAQALATAGNGPPTLAAVRDTVLALRRTKAMVVDAADPDTRSAGSFFTNPIVAADLAAKLPAGAPRWPQPDGTVKLAAAWLIEHAGFARGTRRGRVGISSKHALALVTRPGATTTELLAFAAEIQGGVRARLGVDLAMEPVVA
jgi:UDP-N-acetylmuramate dehydrogenase